MVDASSYFGVGVDSGLAGIASTLRQRSFALVFRDGFSLFEGECEKGRMMGPRRATARQGFSFSQFGREYMTFAGILIGKWLFLIQNM